jgi:TetR/AcrR family tetracycline transcriptional repressor
MSGQEEPCPGRKEPGMAQAPARRAAGDRRARKGRLRRNSLTQERIVEQSLRLLDAHGVAGFSLPKLGRALGADPTAVYRHFASKDDLVLAIADRLIEEAMHGLAPGECWVETLAESVRRLRRVYLAHPAAASLSACRTTQRPAEMRTVDILLHAVMAAGFTGAEAAVAYRAIGDFALSWCGGEAAFHALDARQQATDRSAWTRAYLTAQPDRYPHIWRVREHLPQVTDDDIFETALSFMLGGLYRSAPRPCPCGAHDHAVARPGRGERSPHGRPPGGERPGGAGDQPR